MSIIYDELDRFDRYKSIFSKYERVDVFSTKYSRKIHLGKKKKVLLSKGRNDSLNILPLINRVKQDTNNFIDGVKMVTTHSNDIFWSYYNETCEDTGECFDVAKIDLNSAYWTKAINKGIISKETNDYFESMYFKDVKDKKMARLKAFGSLATVKSHDVYKYGKLQSEFQPLIMNEDFRNIYMGICNDVALDMQTVLSKVNGYYYYWDMIFVSLDKVKEVSNLFNSMGYKFTVEKDKAEIFRSKYISYICCQNINSNKIGVTEYPINN
jgi:hypothetical protein